MKKLFLGMALIVIVSGIVFADFEFEFGLYGGFGTAGAAGFNMQLGYITPAYSGAIGGDEPSKFRWSILADLGIGYRYGGQTYTMSELVNGNREEYTMKYSDGLDFYIGAITEFYFLPFMGIAVGGGVTPGFSHFDNQPFTPYLRAQIPFLFNNVKLGLSFDYILWDDSELPKEVESLPGYRINLLINLRGDAAGWLFRIFV